MSVTAAETKQAVSQDRDVSRAIRTSKPANLRFSRFIRTAAMFAIENGHNSVMLAQSRKVEDIFVDASALSYMLGIKSELVRNSIKLSINSKAREIAKRFDVDLGDAKRNLRTATGRALRRAIDPLERRLNAEISNINSRGLTRTKAKHAMSRSLDRMGLSAFNQSYIDTLMRTHMQFAYAAARWQTSIDDPSVRYFKYVTMEDNLVRESHEHLHGLTRLKTDPIWLRIWTPNGWNCRCQILALRRKTRQTRIPRNIKIDDGFEFNAGVELNVL